MKFTQHLLVALLTGVSFGIMVYFVLHRTESGGLVELATRLRDLIPWLLAAIVGAGKSWQFLENPMGLAAVYGLLVMFSHLACVLMFAGLRGYFRDMAVFFPLRQ